VNRLDLGIKRSAITVYLFVFANKAMLYLLEYLFMRKKVLERTLFATNPVLVRTDKNSQIDLLQSRFN
jgi:hypothetical protein